MDLSNKYINEFFGLTCYPDILDILNPISGRKKEITESMAVMKQIRRIVFKQPDQRFYLFDFCAGNALTSAIASFLYPNIHSYAIDKRVRDRQWSKIRRFMYVQSNIYKERWEHMTHQHRAIYPMTDFIVIGVHPCRGLNLSILFLMQ